MKKILLVVTLLIVCAALEVPEDYQWSPNGTQDAAVGTHTGCGRICTTVANDSNVP